MELVRTLDFQKRDSGINHLNIGNSTEIALREDIQNGVAYSAKNFLFICFFHDGLNEYYQLSCHDGEQFEDSKNIIDALDFNKTGGRGVQGSGGKTSMYGFNKKTTDCKVVFASKTKNDGEKAYMLYHVTEATLDVKDVTELFIDIFKIILGDEYKKYNVFYCRRYNPSIVNNHKGKGNNSPLITNTLNMHSLGSMIANHDINIRFLDYHLNKVKSFDPKHLVNCIKDIDEYVSKSFKFIVKDIEHENTFLGEKTILKYDAEFKIQVMPNITNKENKTHNVIFNNQYFMGFNPKITPKTHNKYTFFLYQDCKREGDFTNRAITEPVLVSKNINRLLLMELGVEHLDNIFKGDKLVNNKKLIKVLNDYFINDHNLDYKKYVCEPTIRVTMYLTKIKDTYEYFGSFDNTFYLSDESRIRELVIQAAAKANDMNIKELTECRKYVNNFVPENKYHDILPCYSGILDKKLLDIEIRTTKEGSKLAKTLNIKIPNKENAKIKSLPYGMTAAIQVKIYNRNDGTYVETEDIKPTHEGIVIEKDINSDNNVYLIRITKLFHINDKGEKISHSLNEHKLGSPNYYPKTSHNNFIIDGIFQKADLNVYMPLNRNYSRNGNGQSAGGNTGDDEHYDYYKNLYETPQVIALFDAKKTILHPNTANSLIKQMTFNKDRKYLSLWKKIYKEWVAIAVSVYGGNYDIVDKYQLRGDLNALSEDVYSEKGAVLNILLKMYISQSVDCKKLMSTNTKIEKKSVKTVIIDNTPIETIYEISSN